MTIVLMKKRKPTIDSFLGLKNYPIDENGTIIGSSKNDTTIDITIKHNKSGLQSTSSIRNVRLPNSMGVFSIRNTPYTYDYQYGIFTNDILYILKKSVKTPVVVATLYKIGYSSTRTSRMRIVESFGDIFGDDCKWQ